jgi:hypothetical protein
LARDCNTAKQFNNKALGICCSIVSVTKGVKMKQIAAIGVLALLTSSISSTAMAQGSCNTSLAYLDARLPRYDSNSTLRDLRQTILQEDMVAAYRRARGAGLTPSQVAQMSLQQADQNDAAAEQSAQCFNSLTTGPSIRAQVDSGNYQFNLDSMRDSCAGAYAATRMGAIAMRETAVNMVCLSRAMP